MREPFADERAGHVGDQQRAPLHRHVLENDQVDGQGAQPRPGRQGGARHARRTRGCVLAAAGAAEAVQVVLHSVRHRGGHFLLLKGPGNPPGQRRPPGRARTRRHPRGSDPRSGPGPPRSSTRPDCPAASPASSSRRPAVPGAAASVPAGHPSWAESRKFPLFRDSARSALSNRSRRSATIASSTAICSACSRISASRGSSGSGAPVTVANHPAGRRPLPRQHQGRRRNVASSRPAQLKRRVRMLTAVGNCAGA
jgi:hypothetical protein